MLASDGAIRWERRVSTPTGDGVLVTYDGEANAGYVHITGEARPSLVARTVDLGHGVLVDVGHDGAPCGVEVLGREPSIGDLVFVLQHGQDLEGD